MLRTLYALSFVLVVALFPGCSYVGRQSSETRGIQVVLVHGAFQDGSAWDSVAAMLRANAVPVLVPELPLTSLAEDVDAVRASLRNVYGTVLLVGHSWGAAVITEMSADPRVAGLIYVAGDVPAIGQSTRELMSAYPAPVNYSIGPDTRGMLHITQQGMCRDLAPGLPAGRCEAMAARQRPIAARSLSTALSTAPPVGTPIWYLLAEEDRAVLPELQRAMIARLHAHSISIHSGHSVPQAAPEAVTDLIEAALSEISVPRSK